MAGLTGDPDLDAMVGPAMRLTGALRTWDRAEVRAAFDDAARTSGGDALAGARTLAVLCAAMVPWDQHPSELLAWSGREREFHRLTAAGVDPATAADVCAGIATSTVTHTANP